MREMQVTFSMWGLTQNGLFGPQTTKRRSSYWGAFRGEHQSWILKGWFKFMASVKICRKNRCRAETGRPFGYFLYPSHDSEGGDTDDALLVPRTLVSILILPPFIKPSSPLLFLGFGFPRISEAKVRERVQDSSAGPPSDPGDRCREHPEGADGRAHTGDGGLASEHLHPAGAQLAGQQHRRHPPQEEKGQQHKWRYHI